MNLLSARKAFCLSINCFAAASSSSRKSAGITSLMCTPLGKAVSKKGISANKRPSLRWFTSDARTRSSSLTFFNKASAFSRVSSTSLARASDAARNAFELPRMPAFRACWPKVALTRWRTGIKPVWFVLACALVIKTPIFNEKEYKQTSNKQTKNWQCYITPSRDACPIRIFGIFILFSWTLQLREILDGCMQIAGGSKATANITVLFHCESNTQTFEVRTTVCIKEVAESQFWQPEMQKMSPNITCGGFGFQHKVTTKSQGALVNM